MGKLKKFWDDHKVVICVVGGVVVVATAAYFLLKNKRPIVDLANKKAINWEPKADSSMTLEKVKEFLEANKETTAQFAIFREGPNPNEYVTIVMDNEFVIPGVS